MKQSKVLEATHQGTIYIGELAIPCYVLSDGSRVLNQTGVMRALGLPITMSAATLITQSSLRPFITQKFLDEKEKQVHFKAKNKGGAPSSAYGATLLVELCAAFVNAEANAVGANREKIKFFAERARLLQAAFAKTGITALIDEATGYDKVRGEMLQEMIQRHVSEELAKWAKRFPDDFYRELFRLNGWTWNNNSKRPPKVGEYTVDLVYERLCPGLIQKLREKNPKTEKGHRKVAHHQWLSEEVGDVNLAKHLHAVTALMKVSKNWGTFKRRLNEVFPKKNEQMLLGGLDEE